MTLCLHGLTTHAGVGLDDIYSYLPYYLPCMRRKSTLGSTRSWLRVCLWFLGGALQGLKLSYGKSISSMTWRRIQWRCIQRELYTGSVFHMTSTTTSPPIYKGVQGPCRREGKQAKLNQPNLEWSQDKSIKILKIQATLHQGATRSIYTSETLVIDRSFDLAID